ncbi:hypothetical protein DFH08DRAFT_824959 [Mycena albidolilacea]|uniref:Uncharacterized protein n=1 Tax=Mycena albidolilacea TaxID=1033008 RepID=A0AAD7E9Y8_9AGAR|nr:hypothetical protein DFH08DRAFT_824959 [Mycena albidolilacea]
MWAAPPAVGKPVKLGINSYANWLLFKDQAFGTNIHPTELHSLAPITTKVNDELEQYLARAYNGDSDSTISPISYSCEPDFTVIGNDTESVFDSDSNLETDIETQTSSISGDDKPEYLTLSCIPYDRQGIICAELSFLFLYSHYQFQLKLVCFEQNPFKPSTFRFLPESTITSDKVNFDSIYDLYGAVEPPPPSLLSPSPSPSLEPEPIYISFIELITNQENSDELNSSSSKYPDHQLSSHSGDGNYHEDLRAIIRLYIEQTKHEPFTQAESQPFVPRTFYIDIFDPEQPEVGTDSLETVEPSDDPLFNSDFEGEIKSTPLCAVEAQPASHVAFDLQAG